MEFVTKLRPSSAARIVQCPGSFQLCDKLIVPDTAATLEGTAAHEVAFKLWDGVPYQVDDTAANGVIVNDEMVEAAKLYVETIKDIVGHKPAHVVRLEQHLTGGTLHALNEGTPDAWYWDQTTNIIHVFDFKYGHKYVSEYENWQLINYAELILAHIGTQSGYDTVRFHFHIIQPRCYHRGGAHRDWGPLTQQQLAAYWDTLRDAYAEATSEEPRTRTGDECEYCPARHTCGALRAASYSIIESIDNAIPCTPTPVELGIELSKLRRALERLQAMESGIAAELEAIIRNGNTVPGWHIEPNYGREKWVDENKVIDVADLMGVNVTKRQLITPNQAIKAGLPEELVRKFTIKPAGAGKLSSETSDLQKIFNN